MLLWQWLWTVVWFAGVGVFSILSIAVIYYGARDLTTLLRGLQREPTRSRDGGVPN